MRLILVRHGDAHAGLHGVIAGPIGCRGLTDLGREQAAALRDRLASDEPGSVDVLLSSVLPRAVETAEIIAPALGFDAVPRDCDLCEVHTGEADGVDWADHAARYGPIDMIAEPDRPFAPGGESWNGFHERVGAALERLANEHVDRTVMAVCHAGVIAASLRVLLPIPLRAGEARLVPTNTARTEWDHDAVTGRWTLRTYDDARHLPG